MINHLRVIGWMGLAFWIVVVASIFTMHLVGDGYEYLLTTHALYSHGSPDVRSSDVEELIRLNPEGLRKPFASREILSALNQKIGADKSVPFLGFYPDESGNFYAMHFFLYSLLAVPFYAVLRFFSLNPVWAFGLLNLAFIGVVFAYLKRALPDGWRPALVLFLLMGTVFYVRWTGPEVMAASFVFVACLAILRGQIALGILMSGLGATQNPSIIFLMPLALGYGLLIFKQPQWACFETAPSRPSWQDGLMALVGIVLGLMSYAFFQWVFHTPSLIAQYGTYPSLISLNRLFSLFFDLNQGMVVGLPGLALALFPAIFITSSLQRMRWLGAAFLLILSTFFMAVPTLSTGNWNPGGAVMLRYNYWLGMPLLVLLILGLSLLPTTRAKWFFYLALLLQGLVWVGQGFEKSSNTRHTPLARWVLTHFPTLYNPEAEIFYERSLGLEEGYTIDLVYLYKSGGYPRKLLRHWSNYAGTKAELCPAGNLLQGSDLREVGQGWQYLHPPFRCEPRDSGKYPKVWRIRAERSNDHSILGSGWSTPESAGVWSDGPHATLTLPIPSGAEVRRVRFKGQYYGTQRTSVVTINDRPVGDINLMDGAFEIPVDMRKNENVRIVLRHPHAASPKSRGESADARQLGYYLEAVSID